MRFNSIAFFAFLAIVVIVLWILPRKARRWWLLGVSYIFYGSWHYPYLALLVGCAALNHWGAKWIVASENRARRGRWVLAANVLLLAAFKYLDWLVGNVNSIFALFGEPLDLPLPNWVLPLGISFYVFESISYTVDVIRKRERVHNFWDFQLFIAFFPKLIAGPILRAKEFLPQIEKAPLKLAADQALDGLWLLASGLFLKTVIADGLISPVDAAYALAPSSLGATDVYLMGVAFGLQIYFDFSSYTRMALGSAKLCGIQLVENFNYPYSATSPVDFWNRWHMSLSRWIRDYLFFPLLGKQTSLAAMCRAAMISMTLCGIWHGAGWTFVLWGAYHGALIAGYHGLTYGRQAVNQSSAIAPFRAMTATVVTFGLVSLGWLIFRSQSIEQAIELIGRGLTPWEHNIRALPGTFYLQTALLVAAVWLAPFAARWCALLVPPSNASMSLPRMMSAGMIQGVAVGVMITLCLIYMRGQTAFIYFQF